MVRESEMRKIEELQRAINYEFHDKGLFLEALTHSSYINEHPDEGLRDNERLEFLGDAVLDLVIGDLLYNHYQEADEGELSKFRASLVDERALFEQAQRLGLGQWLLLGKGEEQGGGRTKPSILAGAFEALIGAIYLDGGYDEAMGVIKRLFRGGVLGVRVKVNNMDFKTTLQELTQSEFKCLPIYRIEEESGPPHDRRYKVALYIMQNLVAHGHGRSKKEAEQDAAREGLSWLRKLTAI